jgi:deoxyribose-phosphate aldolase
MSPAEIEALVAQVGDEILGRLGLSQSDLERREAPPEAPATAWSRPRSGYGSAIELICGAPELTASEVAEACRRACSSGLPVVWTPSSSTAVAVAQLEGSTTRAGALIDFPGGSSSTPTRLADVETTLRLGAELVNLTVSAGRARSAPDSLSTEVGAAAELCVGAGAALAVTLEADHLSDEDLVRAAAAALEGGADALCSSTGRLSHAFASDRAIAFLRETVKDRAVVVAGGRIASFGHAAALISAGADRVAVEGPWALLDGAPA